LGEEGGNERANRVEWRGPTCRQCWRHHPGSGRISFRIPDAPIKEEKANFYNCGISFLMS
jgi:hypothetical protein